MKDGLNAMVSIKAQSTGPDGKLYAAGMGVGVENTPEGMQTQVLFLADRLALINLANGVVSTPFAIENGQTFIRSAFIQDGTITSAKIGNASIGSVKLADVLRSDATNPQGLPVFSLNMRSGLMSFNGTDSDGSRTEVNNKGMRYYYPNGVLGARFGGF